MDIYNVVLMGEGIASRMFSPSCYAVPFSTKKVARKYVAKRLRALRRLCWRSDERGTMWSTKDDENVIKIEKMALDDMEQ